MRHGKKFNHLGRQKGHRSALLSNMATSLIMHKRINTTVAKAKALRKYVEPLITKSKEDSTHSRRVVFSYLQDKEATKELFGSVAGKVADRPGGYTRILKTGFRSGDSAEMCLIELVDFNENLLDASPKKKSSRRRKKKASAPAAAAPVEAKEEVAEDAAPAIEEAEVVEEATEAKAEEVVEAKAEEAPAEEAPAAEETSEEESSEEEEKKEE